MKTSLYSAFAVFLTLPALASAQTLQKLFADIPTFIDIVLIPFLFGIAFLIFVINAIRFFVIGGSNEDGRKNAKTLVIYSIAAFVFLIIFWGIVNMLSSSAGFSGETQPCTDYQKMFGTCP